MHSFEHDTGTSRAVFGAGTLSRVGAELERLGARHALVLCTPARRGLADRVCGVLGGAAAGVFDGAAPHTPVEVTEAALARAREVAADSVVSVGGGSTTGLGKALSARTGMPHLVVPTTYAGSEVTSLLGETANGEKVTRTGPEILPAVVVYDVALTASLPWPVTVTSAVNAMAHAVEALYAPDRTARDRRAGGRGAARPGRRAAGPRRRPRRPSDPDDLDARADLLYGAWLAGRCLDAVGMGLHHKLCHTLGGSFGLPHAATHTVVLPHAMAYNAPAAPEAMRAAAAALGVDDAPAGLQALVARLGGPTNLHDLGFGLDDVPRAATLATARPYPNPRPVQRDGIVELLTRATARHHHPPSKGEPMSTSDPAVPSPADLEARRHEIREAHLRPTGSRPASTARGLHHTALISSDVERTVRFYQDVLGVPADRADREPRLPRLLALLLRHRQLQPAGLLRLPRARRRAVRRGARRPAPRGDLGGARALARTWSTGSPRPGSSTRCTAGCRSTSATPTARASS